MTRAAVLVDSDDAMKVTLPWARRMPRGDDATFRRFGQIEFVREAPRSAVTARVQSRADLAHAWLSGGMAFALTLLLAVLGGLLAGRVL